MVESLLSWFKSNQRDLPWRHTRDPYFIWLSEVILQQTRVAQGLDYYMKFVEAYPQVEDLANAPIDEVLKMWQGLGYYSRARNMHEAAKFIAENGFPDNFQDIRKLKGVGDYTASAIASFAFGESKAVVDGNVYRVLSRYFGIHTAIDSGAGKKEFQSLADQLIADTDPATWNQTIMEFGALQCTPKNPDCSSCPVAESCVARSRGEVEKLPFKKGKTKTKKVYIQFAAVEHKGRTYLEKRPDSGIWGGLYEFPNLTSDSPLDLESLIKEVGIEDNNFVVNDISGEYKHLLSHREIKARFFRIELNNPLDSSKWLEVNLEDLGSYAVHRLMEKYLNDSKFATDY